MVIYCSMQVSIQPYYTVIIGCCRCNQIDIKCFWFLFSGDILTSAYTCITTPSLDSFHVTFQMNSFIFDHPIICKTVKLIDQWDNISWCEPEDLVASSLIGWFKIWTLTWPHTGSVVVVRWLCITINNNKKRYNHLILIWLLHMCCYLLVANILQE